MIAKGRRAKQTKVGATPSTTKQTAGGACANCDVLDSASSPAWRFDLILNEPIFGWDTVTKESWDQIMSRLCEFEKMKMSEIFNGQKAKTYNNPLDIPNDDARKRYKAEYDDRDQIHRLEWGGLPRLFGFRKGNVFEILWWDPNHEIWPAKKKHT